MSPASPSSPPECPFDLVVRPTGLVLLCVTVPSLDPWRAYQRRDPRLWLRWAEPEETGLDEPRLELAMAARDDEVTGTAWVVVRSQPVAPNWPAVFGVLKRQGLLDVWVVELDNVDAVDGGRLLPWSAFKAAVEAGEPVYWLACVHFADLAPEAGVLRQFRYR